MMHSKKFSLQDNIIYYGLNRAEDRTFIRKCVKVVSFYLFRTLDFRIKHQKNFVDASFYLIHFLCSTDFKGNDNINDILDFLNHAADVLKASMDEDCKEDVANYFYKIAVIFQTATDEFDCKRSHMSRAINYIKKADEVRGVRALDYQAKMLHLYQQFIESYEMDFIKNILQTRWLRYQRKLEVEKQQSFLHSLLSFFSGRSTPRIKICCESKPTELSPLFLESKTSIDDQATFLRQRMKRMVQTAKQRTEQSQSLLKKNPDDPAANYILAQSYEAGWGEVKSDFQTALQYYEIAAKQSHAGACYKLAQLYLHGDLLNQIEIDFNLAEHYAQKGKDGRGIKSFDSTDYNQENFVQRCDGLLKVIQATKDMKLQSKTKSL